MDHLGCLQSFESSLCGTVVSKHFQIGKRNLVRDRKCCVGHVGNDSYQQRMTLSCLFRFHLVVPHATFSVKEMKEVFHVDPLHLQACFKDPRAENMLVTFIFKNRKLCYTVVNK